jgi:hypothetical protein
MRWTDLWGADPCVGAGRAQSTSKDLAQRGRNFMLHGGQLSRPFSVGAPIELLFKYNTVGVVFPLPVDFFSLLVSD